MSQSTGFSKQDARPECARTIYTSEGLLARRTRMVCAEVRRTRAGVRLCFAHLAPHVARVASENLESGLLTLTPKRMRARENSTVRVRGARPQSLVRMLYAGRLHHGTQDQSLGARLQLRRRVLIVGQGQGC